MGLNLQTVSVGEDGIICGVTSDASNNVYYRSSLTSAWFNAPSIALKQVSCANGNNIVGIKPDNSVVKYAPISQQWIPLGQTQQFAWVSIGGDGSVWGISTAGAFYTWDGNSSWVSMPKWTDGTSPRQVSVGDSQHIWALDSQNNSYQWNGGGWMSAGKSLESVALSAFGGRVVGSMGGRVSVFDNGTWSQLPAAGSSITNVSASSRLIVALDATNGVYSYGFDPINNNPIAGNWQTLASPSGLRSIGAGEDGSFCAVSDSKVYTKASLSADWVALTNQPVTTLKQVTCPNKNNLFGVGGSDNAVYRYLAVPNMWKKISGDSKNWISVGADGAMWGVAPDGKPYIFDEAVGWYQMAGLGGSGVISKITLGDNLHILALDTVGKTYNWNGNAWVQLLGVNGQGNLKLGVGAGGFQVVGIRSDGSVVQYSNSAWSLLPGASLVDLSVTSRMILGLDSSGVVRYISK